jgi:hypothetical protein
MDPVVVGTVGARPLQGREPEMALLASLIDGVGSKGASLVLRGEPGIGKSRLLREAITLAEDRNMTVVSTSGVQAEARLSIRWAAPIAASGAGPGHKPHAGAAIAARRGIRPRCR